MARLLIGVILAGGIAFAPSVAWACEACPCNSGVKKDAPAAAKVQQKTTKTDAAKTETAKDAKCDAPDCLCNTPKVGKVGWNYFIKTGPRVIVERDASAGLFI